MLSLITLPLIGAYATFVVGLGYILLKPKNDNTYTETINKIFQLKAIKNSNGEYIDRALDILR